MDGNKKKKLGPLVNTLSNAELGHTEVRCVLTFTFVPVCMFVFQAVEELLEFLELEKSSYHMGLSRVSSETFSL